MAKLMFCDKCEEWVEPENGSCPLCGTILKSRKNKVDYDNWEEPDDEWGGEEGDYYG